jgi:protoheme IX farnesyltransferase
VSWAAVTGDLSWTAWLLFAIVCLWTPPHFWALALLLKDEYAQVGVPMLPVVAGNSATTRQIFIYSLLLVPVTLLLVYPLHALGMFYGAIALLLGGILIQKAWALMQSSEDQDRARSLFKFSILYLLLLCASMAIDTLLCLELT